MPVVMIAPLIILASLPLIAKTATYPVAVVEGNSMYPALHNGDLVYYTASRGSVQNGTIIVFVQGESGVNAIDTLLKPIVIHRVVGFGYNADGSLYYQTKGDNNAQDDPFVTPASSVLGIESNAVPYAGLPIQFLKSAYGMLTVVAMMSLFFFSGVDTRFWEEDERKRLLAVFASHSFGGAIPTDQFEKLKLVIEGTDVPIDLLKDEGLRSMANWLKEGGLSEEWREETRPCPKCGSSSYHIVSGDHSLVICPACMRFQGRDSGHAASPATSRILSDRPYSTKAEVELSHPRPFVARQTIPFCGVTCPRHSVPCILRRDHQHSHHHLDLDGSFCFFD